MYDLISRQALREAMYHEAFETDSDMQKWDSGCWIRYKMFENAIESAPTIDPVKHGCGAKMDEPDKPKQISAEFAKLMREGEIQVRWKDATD